VRASATTLAPEVSASELASLISNMLARSRQGRHLEIGTAAGGSLREMMLAYPTERRPPFVVIDPMTYFPDQLSIVRRNLSAAGLNPDEVDFRVSKSWPAFQAAEGAGERYAFMFIDGSHKAHRVMQDLAWTRLLEPGGLLCLHDYAPRTRGVVWAVDRFLARYPHYRVVDRVEKLLVVLKTANGNEAEVGRRDRLQAHLVNTYHQFARGLSKRLRRYRT
jgi:predicted O-methyltransferase YrrM